MNKCTIRIGKKKLYNVKALLESGDQKTEKKKREKESS